jgi:hypothetical protein
MIKEIKMTGVGAEVTFDYCGDVRHYLDGLLHREDGPAVIDTSGCKTYYLYDKRLTKEQFNAVPYTTNRGEQDE